MKKTKRFKKSPPKKDGLTKVEHEADNLIAYDRFKQDIAPELRKLLAKNASSSEIIKKFSNYATARLMTIALAEKDPKTAFAAIKDVLDRAEGKAVERKRLEHSMSNIEDRDLDALLKSEMAELENMGDEEPEVGDE